MKQLARILSLLTLAAACIFLSACDKSDGGGTSEKETQIGKLVGTWSVSAATLDGVSDPYTADYSNMDLTISKSSSEAMTFVTTGRPAGKLSPWDANGTFSFGTPVTSKLVRGDNVEADYSVSGSTLTITLTNYTGEGYAVPGRVESVEGTWVFTFTKN